MTVTYTRRQFLQAGTSASLGLAAVPALLADDKTDPAFGGFAVGVQSYTFRNFSTEQALKRIQYLGLRFVEFFRQHARPDSSVEQIQALRRLCADYGITPIAFGVEMFTKDHDKNKRLFEFGQALGIKHLSADPDPDSFDSLDKLVEEYKISIAIHPHGPVGRGELHRWHSAEVILQAVRNHHPLIGSCLDTGHLIRADQLGKKLDPAQQIRLMGARNFGIHLKDHDNARKTDVPYGKGVLDVPGVLKALKDVQFKGYISIEYEAKPEDPTSDVKQCVDFVRQAIQQL